MQIRFHPEVAQELIAAVRWYDSKVSGLGDQFMQAFARGLNVITRSPHIGPVFAATSRRFLLRRFPYGIIYHVTDDNLIVLALAHLKRKPDYWKKRSKS